MSDDSWQSPNEHAADAAEPASTPKFPFYPGNTYGYAAPEPLTPAMPGSVRLAVNLMFTGAAIAGIGLVIGLTQLGQVDDRLRALGYSDTTISADKGAFIALTVISGLIGSGVWLWMALATRKGHNYARIVSTVFFGIGLLGGLNNLTSSWIPVIGRITSVVTLTLGLIAVVSVWRKESGPYFQPRYGYGTGQAGQPGRDPYDHR